MSNRSKVINWSSTPVSCYLKNHLRPDWVNWSQEKWMNHSFELIFFLMNRLNWRELFILNQKPVIGIQQYWTDCTDIMFFYRAALLQLNWTIFKNDELTSAKQWHLFFRAALHQKSSLHHWIIILLFIPVKLLWNNLYCIKRYINRGDLTW